MRTYSKKPTNIGSGAASMMSTFRHQTTTKSSTSSDEADPFSVDSKGSVSIREPKGSSLGGAKSTPLKTLNVNRMDIASRNEARGPFLSETGVCVSVDKEKRSYVPKRKGNFT